MLPRRERLTREEIAGLMESGRKYAGRFFYARALSGSGPKAAFSIGKKIARFSITRHLIKRRASHALREVWRDAPPVHLFLIARPEARAASYAALCDDLRGLMRQIAAKSVY